MLQSQKDEEGQKDYKGEVGLLKVFIFNNFKIIENILKEVKELGPGELKPIVL